MYKHGNKPVPFAWAVGFENTFVPQSRLGLRPLEEYELMQHYSQWREDLRRAAELGVRVVRWGVPWYLVEARQGEYDWRWVDEVLQYMICELKIDPIIDLIHYGTPLWMENSFVDERYVESVTAFEAAFATRYRHLVTYYTPLNEPTVNAEFCGRNGQWPPYLTGESGYVQVLLQLARGMQASMRAIATNDAKAVFVAVEAMHHYRPLSQADESNAEKAFLADLLCFDLVQGKVSTEHLLYQWLLDNGATAEELKQLRQRPAYFHIFGLNFYPWAAFHVSHQGDQSRIEPAYADGRMLADIIRDCHKHSGLPIFISETSAADYRRSSWMTETTDAVKSSMAAGIPVVGYTWFPAFSMIAWDYRTTLEPVEKHLLHLGLWDVALEGVTMERHETPLVAQYRHLVEHAIPSLTFWQRLTGLWKSFWR